MCVCVGGGVFIFRESCVICSVLFGDAWRWTGGATRGSVKLCPILLVSQGKWVVGGPTSSQSFRYNSNWLCMGSTLSLFILAAVLPQPPPPSLLNVQRIAKTVPFTNAVHPLVLRSEWAVEMASLLPPLAVETLCKEYI